MIMLILDLDIESVDEEKDNEEMKGWITFLTERILSKLCV